MAKPKSKGAALITGGAKRVAKIICLELAEAGYDIALHYNTSKSDAETVQHQIQKIGRRCEIFSCDLLNEFQTSRLVGQAFKKFLNLNVLVNSASIFEKSTLLEGDVASLEKHWAIHVKAPFILSSAFAKLKPSHGHIINILDTNVVKNKTSHVSYLISKKALWELTKISAVELGPNVRVNGVAPGLILPPADEKTDYLDRMAKNIPLKKKGDPSQIAQSVKFLIEHPYITGQIIFVDGGEHLV